MLKEDVKEDGRRRMGDVWVEIILPKVLDLEKKIHFGHFSFILYI